MARRGMHRARALLERDVFAEHAERIAVVEGVPELDAFELRARNARDLAGRADGRWPPSTASARASARMTTRLPSTSYAAYVAVRMERDRQVRRNRPGRGRPDQHRDVACRRAPGHATPAACRTPTAGTRRRSTATCGCRTRLRLRPAPSDRAGTSARASCPCRRARARRSCRARGRSSPETPAPSSGTADPSRRGCRAA